jgi:hypothetical protein
VKLHEVRHEHLFQGVDHTRRIEHIRGRFSNLNFRDQPMLVVRPLRISLMSKVISDTAHLATSMGIDLQRHSDSVKDMSVRRLVNIS